MLLYEDETKEKESNKSIAKTNKVSISEFEEKEYKNSVFLEIENNNTEILKYGTEVHFVDIVKYAQNDENTKEIDLEQYGLDNEILFVGTIKRE